ncbi:hypothetical protein WBJ53_12330 [Spirosoma sp. SC4-14]
MNVQCADAVDEGNVFFLAGRSKIRVIRSQINRSASISLLS